MSTIREHAEAIFQDPDTSWSAHQHAQAILDALDAATPETVNSSGMPPIRTGRIIIADPVAAGDTP